MLRREQRDGEYDVVRPEPGTLRQMLRIHL